MALYRKYRPKNFVEMVGQNHVKLTLQNELATENVAHAYLFCGPRGLGKTTAARLLAKAVNCENRKKGESEPCNKCRSCLDIMDAKALDMIEIDAASHTGVDNVRENIIENVRFSPNQSKFKVFIIDEVHMLSISAFNALLKTLEEPPAHAMFVLCTTEIHKVPETIISRCQRFDFKKVSAAEIIKRLKRITESEKIKVDDEVLKIIAAKSEGCMRDAETLLGQILSLGEKKITKEQVSLVLPTSEISALIEFINLLITHNTSAALEFINKLIDEGVDLEVFTKEMIEWLRKLILIKIKVVKSDWIELSSDVQKEADKILENMSIEQLTKMIRIFLQTSYELKNSAIPQLPLELAIINICQPDDNIVSSFRRVETVAIKKQEKANSTVKKEKSESSADLNKIKKEWVNIIKAGHQKSRDLLFINEKMVWPLEIKSDVLEIGFKYDLHKNKFETNSNKKVFSQALEDVVNQELNIKTKTLKPSELAELEMEQEAKQNTKLIGTKVTQKNILNQVLDSFGGEVVEE